MLVSTGAGASNEDIANERARLSGEHYESQWNIDCDKAWQQGSAILAQDSSDRPNAQLLEHLRLCGIIYNNKESHRYRHEPDYRGMLEQLREQQNLGNRD